MSRIPARASSPQRGTLPPCCLPGAAGITATSFLDALDARPTAVLALAAAIMLALGPSPVAAQQMALVCTQNGLEQVPVNGQSKPEEGIPGCAHACMVRERRRG